MFGQRMFFGTPMTARMATWIGARHRRHHDGLLARARQLPQRQTARALGALYTALAVVFSTLGSLVAHRNHDAKIPIWQSMAWGMLYGALFSIAWTWAAGKDFAFEATPAYVLSLLYLVVFGSILAFAAYLTLLGRIGAARSGYVGVMVPIVALLVSAVFEGFRWHALTWVGIAVSLLGNVLVLKKA